MSSQLPIIIIFCYSSLTRFADNVLPNFNKEDENNNKRVVVVKGLR